MVAAKEKFPDPSAVLEPSVVDVVTSYIVMVELGTALLPATVINPVVSELADVRVGVSVAWKTWAI